MKVLFFDLEYASSKNGSKICEFGFVQTDELLNITNRGNLIINPNSEWDPYVVDSVIQRDPSEYMKSEKFDHYYPIIKRLLDEADYIVGHSLDNDARAFNFECKRYHLPSLDFEFYDENIIYQCIKGDKRSCSVENILIDLGVQGDERYHDAEVDSYNTMLGIKAMMEKTRLPFVELLAAYPRAKDKSEKFQVASQEERDARRLERFEEGLRTPKSNILPKNGKNRTRFLQLLDNTKPKDTGVFQGKKLSISINYEENHFVQMLNLVLMIANEGGQIVLKASTADIFVKYEVMLEDGTLRYDSKLNYVLEANANGGSIEIIEFDKLLELLHCTEEELDAMPMPSFDFLYEEGAIIKDKRTAYVVKTKKKNPKKDNAPTVGRSLGEMLEEALKKTNK